MTHASNIRSILRGDPGSVWNDGLRRNIAFYPAPIASRQSPGLGRPEPVIGHAHRPGTGPFSTGCRIDSVRRFNSELTMIIRAVNGTYGCHDGNTKWTGRWHMPVREVYRRRAADVERRAVEAGTSRRRADVPARSRWSQRRADPPASVLAESVDTPEKPPRGTRLARRIPGRPPSMPLSKPISQGLHSGPDPPTNEPRRTDPPIRSMRLT
jgi:hypothetical protein